MDDWIGGFRAAAPVDGQQKVLVPGDPEREAFEQRMAHGIPLEDSVIKDLQRVAAQFSLTLD
jgi:LDH2 family malate/lactate/ureidoglycolate dehydrogenase